MMFHHKDQHAKMKQLISAYIDGEVSQQQKALVENHIKTCRECERFLHDVNLLSSSLRQWPDESLSPSAARALREQYREHTVKGVIPVKHRLLIPAVATATVVIAVSLGVFLLLPTLNRSRQLSTQIVSAKKQPQPPLEKQVAQPKARRKLFEPAASQQEDARLQYSCPERGVTDMMYEMDVAYDASYGGSFGPAVGFEDHFAGRYSAAFHTEEYDRIYENRFLETIGNPLSTFSIDVDTASYSNVRRFLQNGQLPPKDAVRIEEMINYFSYDYPLPDEDVPFSITTEMAECPWNPAHHVALIGLQGKELKTETMPPSNLVFLIDVSGSMDEPDKLPLLKSAFRLLVKNVRPEDRVSLVVYAGAAGLVLDATSGDHKNKILSALEQLEAGGSTAGGEGVTLAYAIAKENYIPSGNNRVILATDGDFNVGISSDAELVRLIEEKREEGIFLTVLGFGTGNYKDAKMEQLADKGNGNYAYIDNILEAKKVFVHELGSTLFTIAKDVKIQIEFNPAHVKAYRLVGYENRMLQKEDFNDDTKDAGELGAGHSVTALYELVPAASEETFSDVDELHYQEVTIKPSTDIMTVKLRYKKPDEATSQLIEKKVSTRDAGQKSVSDNLTFAAAVAEFGLLLRDSEFKGNSSYAQAAQRAKESIGDDAHGYRAEFIRLVETAEILSEVK